MLTDNMIKRVRILRDMVMAIGFVVLSSGILLGIRDMYSRSAASHAKLVKLEATDSLTVIRIKAMLSEDSVKKYLLIHNQELIKTNIKLTQQNQELLRLLLHLNPNK